MSPGLLESFVGREQETSWLTAALDDVIAGRGRVVMLTGEPGIGKTTLAEQLTRKATAANCLALNGASVDGGYTPPLWLWTQVIRNALESRVAADALDRLTDRQRKSLAHLAPELEPRETDAAFAQPGDDTARFELYDSATRFLIHLSRLSPIVLWLDDLHWADASDLALLEFASQQFASSPILVLGTYRDTDITRQSPLTRTLGLLTRMAGFERVQLEGLADSEMNELVTRAAPSPLSANESARLVERAAGNPLFGREMARGHRESATEESTIDRLPEGITEAIGRRMDFLDEAQADVLRAAAVFGREFHLEDLIAATDDEGVRTESTLKAAQEKGLVEEVAAAPGVFRFTHALIKETLRSELTPTGLVQTHARIARALTARHGTEKPEHYSAIARHFREGALVLDLDEAIGHALRAANQALDTYSYLEAADHFDWVLQSMEDTSDSHERAELLYKIGITLLEGELLQKQSGWDRLGEAVRMYIRLGMNEEAVRVAAYPAVIGGIDGVPELVEEALAVAKPGSIENGWLLARYVISLGDAGRYEESEVAFREAIEIAAEHQDDRLRARTLVHGAQSRYRADDLQLSIARGLQAIELSLQVNDYLGILRVLSYCLVALCQVGRTREALALIEQCRDLPAKTAHPNAEGSLEDPEYVLALNIGDWRRASLRLASQPENTWKQHSLRWFAALNGLRLGNPDLDLHDKLDPRFSKWSMDSYGVAADIASTWLQVRPDPVLLRKNEEILELSYSQPRPTVDVDIKRYGLEVLLSLLRDETPNAEHLVGLHGATSKILPGSTLPIDRLLGLVAASEGDYVKAREHIENAVDLCRRAQFKPSLAWSLFDLVRLAEKSPLTVNFEGAKAAAEEAFELCDEVEMPALAALVRETMDRLAGTRSSNEPIYPGGLSEREFEVLTLIASGKSNQQIADDLYISRFTVIRHVTNIFSKIDVTNRAEATAYAINHNLNNN